MKNRFRTSSLISVICFIIPCAAYAQVNFSVENITIPAYEKYTLKGLDADRKAISMIIEYKVIDDAQTKKKSWEIVTSQVMPGTRTDMTLVIRLADLESVSCKSVRTYDEGSYTQTYELNNVSALNNDPKHFFCANTELLIYILRTFPFSQDVKEVTVRTFGSKSAGYSLSVKNNGLKKINLKSGDAGDGYELELGINIPFWSAFIPKSYYYFRNDPQKTFLKFKGSFFPGGKETEMELVGYSSRN